MVTPIRTVLFDLDGTLADTAPDLANALNRLLGEEGRAQLPFSKIRPVASHGSPALLRLGFGVEPNDPVFPDLRARLLAHYAEKVCEHTRVFPGTDELLAELQRRGMGWGIVTNKPGFLTDPLIARLALKYPPACVVSGDTTANRKPHPEPMLHACTLARSRPAEALYVGDAERDIQAGREAGMRTLVALFGYIGENEHPTLWGADGMIRAPQEILHWIDTFNDDRVP